jgi:rhomboid protease GluP
MDNQTNWPPEQPPQPQIQVVAAPDYKPVVTYVILGITVAVYLLQMATLYFVHIPGLPGAVDIPGALGAKVNELIIQGQWWRLFTPMLLHDDHLPLHIASNMYFLAIVGPRLEKISGPWRFLLLYVVAGFAGNVLSFLFSANPAWGASTALFGLMGAQVIFVLQNRSFLAGNGKETLQSTLTLIVINVFLGFMIHADNWGHIGGLLGGAAFAWFGGTKLNLVEEGYPRFRLEDVRGWREQLIGAALVMIVFGGFALLKILGIAF